MPDALKQIFHADQLFSIVHTRSGIQGAAAEAYQLAIPDRARRVGLVDTPGNGGCPPEDERQSTQSYIFFSTDVRFLLRPW